MIPVDEKIPFAAEVPADLYIPAPDYDVVTPSVTRMTSGDVT